MAKKNLLDERRTSWSFLYKKRSKKIDGDSIFANYLDQMYRDLISRLHDEDEEDDTSESQDPDRFDKKS